MPAADSPRPPAPEGTEPEPVASGPEDQPGAQYRYHRELFPALHDWERTERSIVAFTGERGPRGLLGLDQMGHFGPQGCDLVADAVVAWASGRDRGAGGDGGGDPVDLCELGSGFGGALRYTLDRLTDLAVRVRRAYGVELVAEHCAVSRRISRAQGRTGTLAEICASAAAVPLPDASLDVVVVTGSMPHFPEPGEVLREAGRLLRPGGLLVLTEEVSMTPDGRTASPSFRATHPYGVFFTTPLTERERQLALAGFQDVARLDLTEWATALLAERLKVVRIFHGSVAGIYGTASADLIRDTLTAARAEYLAGRLLPALFTARRSDGHA
ncbi:class I SAM-dependent methyltransferase [Streptomyces sp. LP05-1]|uniref:Class I SAM-dependent methyltransferase n=1 Tax=Streptomyces pyxinae TaxID=2970734 RepID=A0ABT2CEE0_9ACTN|nr:class I SAM-dependent methyltransferase [Streptomyces sp. LP05-1]MCS0635784.1 class I SAM-dependent methyltransferase [Streptomyces sp. LP05-1]